MAFEFNIWPAASDLGNPEEIVSAFLAAQAGFASRGITVGQIIEPIRFIVIDVRPGDHGSAMVNEVGGRLIELMIDHDGAVADMRPHDRFLFVGEAASLSSSEKEGSNRRSVKRDFEFAIRTLQSYGLAHYARIDRLRDCETTCTSERDQYIRSALIGLERFYNPPRSDAYVDAHPINDSRRALELLRKDVSDLFHSLPEIPEFAFVGIPDRDAEVRPFSLLREIGLLHQFGKGDRVEALSISTQLEELDPKEHTFPRLVPNHSSYKLMFDLLRNLRPFAKEFHYRVGDIEISDGLATASRDVAMTSFKLARYDLLRDFGRVLGQGALQILRIEQNPRLLIIDDNLHEILADPAAKAGEPLLDRLRVAFRLAWGPRVEVHVALSGLINGEVDALGAAHVSGLRNEELASQARQLFDDAEVKVGHFADYLFILIDPESKYDRRGPARVQRLANHLAQSGRPRASAPGLPKVKARRMPAILALSLKESSGYVQQCLNMGADAFVAKDRLYHLLFDMARVLHGEKERRNATDKASQFRILRSLKPHILAKLRNTEGSLCIHGGLQIDDRRFEPDPHEEHWIQSLPKADLHCHIGTAIHPDTILLLALNTVGHFLTRNATDRGGTQTDVAIGAEELVDRIAQTVLLSGELFRCKGAGSRLTAMELLAASAAGVRTEPALEAKIFGQGDAIVEHLRSHHDHCDESHATALLVAMIAASDLGKEQPEIPRYFDQLGDASSAPTGETFSAIGGLALECERARAHFIRVACRWDGNYTRGAFEKLVETNEATFWPTLQTQFEDRVEMAWKYLRERASEAREKWLGAAGKDTGDAARQAALKWLDKAEHVLSAPVDGSRLPTSGDYVVTTSDDVRRGLQFYLRGADLLGSAHLQYPENLWLAALAITRDNAEHNVLYTELRCETTGYTKAGMGAHDATELLRHGFNLASLYVASQPAQGGRPAGAVNPLVRTNILLAAKRHKTKDEARRVVALLDTYLERRPGVADDAHSRREFRRAFEDTIPGWWRPCDVVGFDISGDESKKSDWLVEVLKPLASRSSPVTIHAGEAASAVSIWDAVHSLSALRIGHGLRLGEDIALLGYCVREGICMELCPNSNYYTNGYTPPAIDVREPSSPRYDYPLLQYMREGMEVTIGSDNRYLHPDGETSLTAEYIRAARLVGGLTRWEVLQIVKAGFKNAFLDKSEVRDMVAAVEEELYRLVGG